MSEATAMPEDTGQTPDAEAVRREYVAVGIRAALHCRSAKDAHRAREWGFDMVIVSEDARRIDRPAVSVAVIRRDSPIALACGV